MLEKHGIACDMMHGFDWAKWGAGKPDGKKHWGQRLEANAGSHTRSNRAT